MRGTYDVFITLSVFGAIFVLFGVVVYHLVRK